MIVSWQNMIALWFLFLGIIRLGNGKEGAVECKAPPQLVRIHTYKGSGSLLH